MRCLSVTCLIRTHVSANLNGSYFTNRQDRYLHFKSTSLSDYCLSFLQSVVPFCFQMRPGNQESYDLSWPDKITSHEQIERKAEKALRGFQKRHLGNTLGETTNPNGNVLIFPIIQAGQFNIREEERSIDLLFKHLNQYTYSTGNAPLVDLTSGYFSLSESYQKLIRDSPADCQILCASPKVWHAPLYLISTSHKSCRQMVSSGLLDYQVVYPKDTHFSSNASGMALPTTLANGLHPRDMVSDYTNGNAPDGRIMQRASGSHRRQRKTRFSLSSALRT